MVPLSVYRVEGKTLLYVAAEKGCSQSIKSLLERGADANVDCRFYYSGIPLHIAIKNGHEKAARMLFPATKSVYHTYGKGSSSETLLYLASEKGWLWLVIGLLEKGAEVDVTYDDKPLAPLRIALYQGYEEVAKLLIRHHIFYCTAKPSFLRYLKKDDREIYARCSAYWDDCKIKLFNVNRE